MSGSDSLSFSREEVSASPEPYTGSQSGLIFQVSLRGDLRRVDNLAAGSKADPQAGPQFSVVFMDRLRKVKKIKEKLSGGLFDDF